MKLHNEEVTIHFNKYVGNDRVALLLRDSEDCPYGVVTVNIPEEPISSKNCSFIDTNNMGEEIIKFLLDNELGSLTGNFAYSGFCVYPEFEFKEELIKEH